MKTLVGAMFLVLVWTAFLNGGVPVSPAVADDQVILLESLDEGYVPLEGNELAGKGPKPYCQDQAHTWLIAIKNGEITGTFHPWYEGAGWYPVTGTKKGKNLHLIATGMCDDLFYSRWEMSVKKGSKKLWGGTYVYCDCEEDIQCSDPQNTSLAKGNCD